MENKANLNSIVNGFTLTYKELIDIIIDDIGLDILYDYVDNIKTIRDVKDLEDYYTMISQIS